jgi:hypothetical protein
MSRGRYPNDLQQWQTVPLTDWTLRYEDVVPRDEGLREAFALNLSAQGSG